MKPKNFDKLPVITFKQYINSLPNNDMSKDMLLIAYKEWMDHEEVFEIGRRDYRTYKYSDRI